MASVTFAALLFTGMAALKYSPSRVGLTTAAALAPWFFNHTLTVVITHLSEFAFYSPSQGEVVPHLFGWRDLPGFIRLRAWRHVAWDRAFYGLLGDLFPMFRYRDGFAGRILGGGLVHLRQQTHDDAMPENFDLRARQMAATFQMSPYSDFQMRAAEEWIRLCERQGCRVILLTGQVNPLLSRQLDPALRRQMLDWLSQMARRHSAVKLVGESSLPAQSAEDYVDLTHATPAARARFTQRLAGLLEGLLLSEPR